MGKCHLNKEKNVKPGIIKREKLVQHNYDELIKLVYNYEDVLKFK